MLRVEAAADGVDLVSDDGFISPLDLVEIGLVSAEECRPDPIEVLERQASTRVPELVTIRYERMLVSPFMFYRGGGDDHGRRSRRREGLNECEPPI